MQRTNIIIMMGVAGIWLVVAAGLWLATTTPASAQCGSQASSCKNCHEVQGEKPVNGDGTAWHTSHAFGDFCYICHAGNNQSLDKDEAHKGMVPPLSDVKASCQQCHPNDLQQRAQVYAAKLGIKVGGGAAPAAPSAPEGSGQVAASASAQPAASSLVTTAVDVNDPNLVDYVQHYDEIVLGKKPINLGNAILIGLIGLLIVGGGGLVITNEKLVNVTFGETKKVAGEYPAEVVDMLPAITRLKPTSRKSLISILENPKKTEKVLHLIDEVVSEEKSEE
jgi:hypothetical protein